MPTGPDREIAVLCSTAVLDEAALDEVQKRLRMGEPLRPSRALRTRAEAVLRGVPAARPPLTRRELGLLIVGNLLLTPLLGYAAWFRLRTDGGPAGRQALYTTVACSALLGVLWLGWRGLGVPLLAD